MKTGPFTTFLSAVVLSASVLGAPLLLKQLTLVTRMTSCYLTALNEGQWSNECASDASMDFGLLTLRDIQSLHVDFSSPDHDSVTLSSPGISVNVISIGIAWPAMETSQSIIIEHNGIDIGRFDTSESPISVVGNVAQTPIKPTTFNILDKQGMVSFATAMMLESTVDIRAKGVTHATFQVPVISSLRIPNIAFSSPVSLSAGGGLSKASLIRLDSSTRDESGLVINIIEINLHNPSTFSVKFGDIFVHIEDQNGVDLGIATLPAFEISIGDNAVSVILHSLNPISPTNQFLVIKGFDGSSQDPTTNAIASSLKMTVTM